MTATSDDVSLREYIEAWQQGHLALHDVHLRAHESEHLAHDRVHVAEALSDERQVATATTALDHRLDAHNGLLEEMRNNTDRYAPRPLVERLDNELRGLPSIFAPLSQVDRMDLDFDRRLLEMTTEIQVLRSNNDQLRGIVSVARFLGAGGLFAALAALVLAFTGHPTA